MNKASYIQALKGHLMGKISEAELDDIISDYEGFFITGMEEGKTEEEISANLGDPKDLAELLSDSQANAAPLCYAPVYKRIPAIIIDIVVAGLPFIWFAPNTALGMYFMPNILFNMVPSLLSTVRISSHQWISSLQPFWTIAIIASALWFLLINPLCLIIFKGYTLGKRLMGIRVVSNDGNTAGILQILVREWFGKYILNALATLLPSVLVLLPSIISLVWAAVPKNKNTVHDFIAHTCVIDCSMQKEGKR